MVYTATPTAKAPKRSGLADYHYDSLDDLLYDWYCRENGYAPVVGFGRADASCAGSASSDQWSTIDEVIDGRIEAYVMPLVSACVDELSSDCRIAILIEQRNRLGPAVYRNPRAGERQGQMYQDAKLAIAPLLRRKGVEW